MMRSRGTESVMTRLAGALFAQLLLASPLWLFAAAAEAQKTNVQFLSVTRGKEDYSVPDGELADYLSAHTSMNFTENISHPADYTALIDDLAGRGPEDKRYVARITPYAFIAAELQGAEFETLATYHSRATNAQIYNSYFVVNVKHPKYKKFSDPPTLPQVIDFLTTTERRTFAYHDILSTSSYFVPAMFFREHLLFKMDPSVTSAEGLAGTVRPIAVDDTRRTLDEVLKAVARGDVDIAAVWDDTLRSLAAKEEYKNLRTVKLEPALPNDLLVCSKNLPDKLQRELREAIDAMPATGPGKASLFTKGDFDYWVGIDKALEAQRALTNLRQDAEPQLPKVTVRVTAAIADQESRYRKYIDAAELGLKTAGTEFAIFVPYHSNRKAGVSRTPDFDWVIEETNAGAIKITSTVNNFGGEAKNKPQSFEVSFSDESTLPTLIAAKIRAQMHRIRFIWPYSAKATVIRDVDFSIPEHDLVLVQPINWTDPEHNIFEPGTPFTMKAGKYHPRKFPLLRNLDEQTAPELDPMSYKAYRVLLVRPETNQWLAYLTVALVVLIVLAAFAAAWDMRREWRELRKRVTAQPTPHPSSGAIPALGGQPAE